jgi:hypothetical protein
MPIARVEVPGWVRACDPEAWRDDQADAQMLAGLLEHGLVERYHSARDWHAHNRWNKARLAWFDAHPDAKHPVEELLERVERDRATGRRGAAAAASPTRRSGA